MKTYGYARVSSADQHADRQVAALVAAGVAQEDIYTDRRSEAGLPVMAHVGMLPQRASLWEDLPVYGTDEETAWELAETAQAMESAGAFAIFLERVAQEAASLIAEKVDIPVIGMGCGPGCDGQALAFHQLLGLDGAEAPPQYVRRFAEGDKIFGQGLRDYCAAVREGTFPQEKHAFPMEEGEAKRIY